MGCDGNYLVPGRAEYLDLGGAVTGFAFQDLGVWRGGRMEGVDGGSILPGILR